MPHPRNQANPRRDSRGSCSDIARWLMFVCGAVAGVLASRTLGRRHQSGAVRAGEVQQLLGESNRIDASARPQAERVSPLPAHERSDVSLALLAGVLVVLALGAFIIHAGLWQWLESRHQRAADAGAVSGWNAPMSPGSERSFPALQTSPAREWQRYFAEQQRGLRQYGYSATNGVAQIPVERAMELIVERGTPTWGAGGRDGVSPLELQRRRAAEGGNPR